MMSADTPSAAERNALLTAVANCGDRAAFARLFQYYAPRIKGLMLREGCPVPLAEELAQETMLAVWRKAALFNPARGNASAWIFTVARNLRIDAQRQERHPSELMPELLMQAELPAQADLVLATDQDGVRVRAALSQLPPEQADVVKHIYFAGTPYGQIGTDLNVPLSTVKSRLRLAIDKLRTALRDLR